MIGVSGNQSKDLNDDAWGRVATLDLLIPTSYLSLSFNFNLTSFFHFIGKPLMFKIYELQFDEVAGINCHMLETESNDRKILRLERDHRWT
jgi:hypothetical protein